MNEILDTIRQFIAARAREMGIPADQIDVVLSPDPQRPGAMRIDVERRPVHFPATASRQASGHEQRSDPVDAAADHNLADAAPGERGGATE